MEKDYFLLKDKIKEIESKFVIKNGWLKIFEGSPQISDDSYGVYCCLVSNKYVDIYNKDYSWPLYMGREGKPSVYGDNSYKTYDKDGLEPFLFYKSFSLPETHVNYFDISEEFVLFFRLYEEGSNKQNRTFYYIDDYGDLDEVIVIQPHLIKIKIKYLKEYIAIREMNFVICYDFMRLLTILPNEWEIKPQDNLIQGENIIYNHLIRNVTGKTQSWIMGKVFIKPGTEKKSHFDLDNNKYEDFIVGYDENGELKYENCENIDGNHFTLTYFKKEVLDKYYNDPNKYKVDGFSVSSRFFTLKIDNNVENYVPVFLIELRMLPYKEQLHWKQYNIVPQKGISSSYYKTMIEGNWAEHPETPDLYFKYKYEEFNKKWEKKFGWKFYKPLSKEDEYLFTALHLPTSNNVKAFCEQMLTIVKLTIDRLNEAEFAKHISLDKNDRGITKFEKFLHVNDMEIPDLITFLRKLWDLRSGLLSHSFSNSNKDCKKAIEYFEINNANYLEVAKEIFIKSVYTLNTLEKRFLE